MLQSFMRFMAVVMAQISGALEGGHLSYRDDHYGSAGEGGDATGLLQLPQLDEVMFMQTASMVRKNEEMFGGQMSEQAFSAVMQGLNRELEIKNDRLNARVLRLLLQGFSAKV